MFTRKKYQRFIFHVSYVEKIVHIISCGVGRVVSSAVETSSKLLSDLSKIYWYSFRRVKGKYVDNKKYKYQIRWCGFYFPISENVIEGYWPVPGNERLPC